MNAIKLNAERKFWLLEDEESLLQNQTEGSHKYDKEGISFEYSISISEAGTNFGNALTKTLTIDNVSWTDNGHKEIEYEQWVGSCWNNDWQIILQVLTPQQKFEILTKNEDYLKNREGASILYSEDDIQFSYSIVVSNTEDIENEHKISRELSIDDEVWMDSGSKFMESGFHIDNSWNNDWELI